MSDHVRPRPRSATRRPSRRCSASSRRSSASSSAATSRWTRRSGCGSAARSSTALRGTARGGRGLASRSSAGRAARRPARTAADDKDSPSCRVRTCPIHPQISSEPSRSSPTSTTRRRASRGRVRRAPLHDGHRHRDRGVGRPQLLHRSRAARRPSPSAASSGTLGPGHAFGEVALVDKSARSATVTATPTSPTPSRCGASGRFVEKRPELAWKLLEILAERSGARSRASGPWPTTGSRVRRRARRRLPGRRRGGLERARRRVLPLRLRDRDAGVSGSPAPTRRTSSRTSSSASTSGSARSGLRRRAPALDRRS